MEPQTVKPRRVLFVTYYFPPSGGSGVQRPLKFVKYLPAYGWTPLVLTVDPVYAAYPDLDPAMAEEVPDAAVIERTRSWDPYRLYARLTGKSIEKAVTVGFLSDRSLTRRERLARWVRGNVFLPDARVGWVPYAVRAGRRLLERPGADVILTTGPPHSAHLIGRALHRRTGVPWVADFRDPWTGIDYAGDLPMSGPARWLDARLERAVLDEASAIVTVSPTLQRAFAERTATPCHNIYNGFDETDVAGDAPVPSEDFASDFVVAHVGNMNAARNPGVLWRVLAGAHAQDAFPRLRIHLVGNVDASVRESLDRYGLTERCTFTPYLPHREAVAAMRASSLLLLPINRVPSAAGILTGKLFEYLAVGRPVVGIGPPDGDAADVLRDAGAGCMVDFEDDAGLRAFLTDRYRAWAAGEAEAGRTPDAVLRYSRRVQTGRLAALLDDLAGSPAPQAASRTSRSRPS